MPAFIHTSSDLLCDGVSVSAIAEAAGTPLYIYSAAAIRERFRDIDHAFGPYPHSIHYALKANSTLAIVRLIRDLGGAADANSGGEIEVALRAGFDPGDVVFTGVGKTAGELERAIDIGVKAINIESAGEVDRIDEIASGRGRRARIAVRINPDIDPQSHPHISTGLRTTKFGIGLDDARELCRDISRRAGLELVGLHVHVGSQIMSLEPLRRAVRMLVDLADELCRGGIRLDHLDVGGGLGISYNGAQAPEGTEYAAALLSLVQASGLRLVLEPGRVLVGPAGVLVGRVVDRKAQPGGKWFVILDAGMTELMRPALYGAFHRIEPVCPRSTPGIVCDIVGPVCETSDTLGTGRTMPLPSVGDLLAIFDAGAYGSVMASNYNRRPMAAEVLVDDGRWRIIRRRQRIDEMLACEEP